MLAGKRTGREGLDRLDSAGAEVRVIEREKHGPTAGKSVRRRAIIMIAAALCALVTAAMIGKFLARDFKDAAVWYDAGQRVLTGQTLAQLPHYRYPPTFAVLVAPLCVFGFGWFFFSWYALNVLLFGLSVRAAGSLVSPSAETGAATWRWLAALLVAVFAIDNLFLGQTNILIMVLIYGAFVEVARGRACPAREWRAGLPLGGAIAIKVFPAPLLAYFLYRARVRVVGSALVWCAFFLVILPAPARGFRRNLAEVSDWGRRVVMPYLSRGQAGDWGQHALDFGNQSLAGVANRYLTRVDAQVMARRAAPIYVNLADLSPTQVNLIVLGVLGALGIAFLAACGWRRPRDAEEQVLEYSLASLLLLLSSAIAWTYFFVLLLLPVMAALRLLGRRERLRASSVWMLRAAMWALVAAILLLANHYARALGSLFWATLVLFSALALARRDLRRSQ